MTILEHKYCHTNSNVHFYRLQLQYEFAVLGQTHTKTCLANFTLQHVRDHYKCEKKNLFRSSVQMDRHYFPKLYISIQQFTSQEITPKLIIQSEIPTETSESLKSFENNIALSASKFSCV